MNSTATTVIHVKGLIDGSTAQVLSDAIVIVEGSKIKMVGSRNKIQVPVGPEVRILDFPDGYLLPGLVDVHTHLMFGTGTATYEEVMERDTDEVMLLRAAKNAHVHLSAGVTTLRDCGARNRITFNLREGANQGLVTAPRLLLCGRPLTITGGHFFWCNEEADGVDAVRAAVRGLIRDGADFIKIMASGGGTAITNNRLPSYSVEELRTIVDEAHNLGKLTTAHCLATQSMRNALDAGVDTMEHAGFIEPNGSYLFDPKIAQRIAKQDMYISPTVQTGYRQREVLLTKERQTPLTPVEQKRLDGLKAKCESQLEFLSKLWHDWGIHIVAGTDAIQAFGDYCLGLELQSQAGMNNSDIIRSATSVAAKAIGIGDRLGTIEPGKEADLIMVTRNPMKDISALRTIDMVMKAGRIMAPHIPTEY